MRLKTFFDKFDQLADAPDAIRKIRGLVLDLAVQGKLVEQIGAEGNGHALLRQIREKNPPLLIENDAEAIDSRLANVPSSWALGKLGEAAEIIRGVSFPGSAKSNARSNGDVACLRTASVQVEIDWDDLIYISPTHVSRPDQWVAPNDIIISMANSYALVGKVAIVRQVPQRATFGAFLAAIRPVMIEPYFLLYALRAPQMQAAFRASSSQTTNIANISLGKMRPLPFPFPPLEEQRRIVAKVDELMALCDRLEAQQQERERQHAALARASLVRVAGAPTPANLSSLFHNSYDIAPEDLRKSILALAVEGKLVPQDPRDEPARDLLRVIEKQRATLVGSQSIRKTKACRPFTGDDTPYAIPETWVWTMLGEITDIGTGSTPSRTEASFWADGTIPWVTSGSTSHSLITEADEFVSPAAVKAHRLRVYPQGTLLVALYGQGKTRGQVAVLGIAASINQACAAICALKGREPMQDYLKLLLLKQYDEVRLMSAGGAQPNLNVQKIKEVFVPLPPLAEQRRIVIKVTQLMALVDELEAQLTASHAIATNLLSAVVAELSAQA
jgi:type I restriction enzyme S subunit